MARIGRLTDDQIIEIRETYEHQRDLADNDPEYYETVMDTEERLAGRFELSRSMVRRIVLGLSYAEVGGPIDEQRRASDKSAAGEVVHTAARITITRPGSKPKSYVHPPGTTVLVEPIVEDPNDYGESGLPLKGERAPSSGKAKGKSTSSPRNAHAAPDEDESLHAELRRRQRAIDDPTVSESMKGIHRRRNDKIRYLLGYGETDSDSQGRGGDL